MCRSGASEMEKALMKKLFANYNLKVRPARNPEERVVVRVGMMLSSFVGLVRHHVLMQLSYRSVSLKVSSTVVPPPPLHDEDDVLL